MSFRKLAGLVLVSVVGIHGAVAPASADPLRIDGKTSDWASIPVLASGRTARVQQEKGVASLETAAAAVQAGRLFVKLTAGGALRYQILLDADADESTGCAVKVGRGKSAVTLAGFEASLTATKKDGKDSQAVMFRLERCGADGKMAEADAGEAEGRIVASASGASIGIEMSAPIDILAADGVGKLSRLAFVVAGKTGPGAVLKTRDGTTAGAPIVFALRVSGGTLTATKQDALVVDANGDSEANVGDTVRYSVTITNPGAGVVTNVGLSDTPDPNTTLVAGTIRSTPLAYGQAVTTDEDTPVDITLTGADPDGDVLTFSIVNPPTNGALSNLTQVPPNSATVHYAPNADANGADSFGFRVTDADDNTNDDTVTLTVNPVNDPPVVDLDPDNSGGNQPDFATSFTEGGGPVLVGDTDLSVTDVDNANLATATATLESFPDGAAESLSADTTGTGITATYTAGTGVLDLSGSDTVENYQQVLRTLSYDNSSQDPNTTARTVAIVANDGTDASGAVHSTIQLSAVNNPPVLAEGGGSPTFTEDGGPVVLDAAIGVSDADSPNLLSATVTLTSRPDGDPVEALAADTTGTSITASYAPATGILSLTGTDSVGNYQQVLQDRHVRR